MSCECDTKQLSFEIDFPPFNVICPMTIGLLLHPVHFILKLCTFGKIGINKVEAKQENGREWTKNRNPVSQ